MQNILILTQYYPPETGAPQNRLSSLANHLKKLGWGISVLTAMPNYPKSEVYAGYKGKFYTKEIVDGIKVYRSWIFVSKKTAIIWRLLNYFSFVFTSLLVGVFGIRKHDIIICESPPLFLGITALILKWTKRSKLVFNVSDLWPETAEQLGIITNKKLLGISTRLEEFVYKHSDLISGQTQGIVNNIQNRFSGKKVHWLPNGIDLNKARNINYTHWRRDNGFSENDFIVLYGGILGYAQNLEVILKAAKLLINEAQIKLIIAGDGPNRENLYEWKDKLQLDNVFFYPTQPPEIFYSIINACNVGVVPLRNIELFRGAIPSKIFEYLLFKKPILLGVDGEAKDLFINKGQSGLFFIPQNEQSLAEKIMELSSSPNLVLQLGNNGYNYVREKFNREQIAADFDNQIRLIVR